MVDKGDCDVLGDREELRVVVFDDLVVGGSEYDAVEVDAFGSSSGPGFGILAGAHGEEESSNDEVGNDGGSGV